MFGWFRRRRKQQTSTSPSSSSSSDDLIQHLAVMALLHQASEASVKVNADDKNSDTSSGSIPDHHNSNTIHHHVDTGYSVTTDTSTSTTTSSGC